MGEHVRVVGVFEIPPALPRQVLEVVVLVREPGLVLRYYSPLESISANNYVLLVEYCEPVSDASAITLRHPEVAHNKGNLSL